ncbi:MAG: MFS transporter [Chlamydiota bacterium]
MAQATASTTDIFFNRTRAAVLWTEILSEPLWTVYNFLAVILYKDLDATTLQVSIFTTLKPMVAIFSLYWSFSILSRRDKLIPNVVWAGILGRLPFFFFPYVNSPWFLIGSAAFFMMLRRGGLPAWMEVIKLNLPQGHRDKVFSLSSAFAYVEGILLSVGVGMVLNNNSHAWRWLFPATAAIGIIAVLIQSRLPINGLALNYSLPVHVPRLKDRIVEPWRQALRLIKERPDFAHFQWCFMISGFALMIIMPALPIFFVDILGISYLDLAIAIGICKGIGFALSSTLWSRALNKWGIYPIIAMVSALFGVFPVLILFTQAGMGWFYLAYFIYGVAQGGSHLCWHMSGPIFARDEDSSLFSSINVVMVGVRGCIGPMLGGILCMVAGVRVVMPLAALLSFLAALKMSTYHRKSCRPS